uniref:Putative site-specific DNA endonuclease n=1 Tax=Monomastix sp. (strain OKE-1) TaxID=141716 RepID=C0JWR2_MONSK|nr:putative site-specific DNA endonuclease [Monomastix sp. OKE-1]ACK36926.1 putative site-specific DNA endonuclease [Monomastix sp. OKE-1]
MKAQSKDNPVLKTFSLSSLPVFPGIYSIKNTQTGFIYIGQSKNIIQRLRAHRSMLERETHQNKKMTEDCKIYGIHSFEVSILLEGIEYESNDLRLSLEKEYIKKFPIEKLYNTDRCVENNSFFGKIHTPELKKRFTEERTNIPNYELGRGICIPSFTSRKGNISPGGSFLSLAEASRVTNMSRRDLRKRLNDPTFPDWRELTPKEQEDLKKQRQQQGHA